MYTVTVEAKGFHKTTLSEQRLVVASTLRMDASLEVGEVSTSITVESVAQQVNTEDAQLGLAMTHIDDLPILSGNGGRNVLALVGLQPGVILSPADAAATSVGPFTVNGQRSQSNSFILDGADSNDLAINIPDAIDIISPNALGEFRVVTGAMKAEYGRNSGSVIESTIKSGTNAFHGEATEIFRNRDLNANNFFLNQAGTDTGRSSVSTILTPTWAVPSSRTERSSSLPIWASGESTEYRTPAPSSPTRSARRSSQAAPPRLKPS